MNTRTLLPGSALLALLAAAATATPQDQIGWSVIRAGAARVDEPQALAGRPDGGVYVAVQSRTLQYAPRPNSLSAFDENGDHQWTYDLGTPGEDVNVLLGAYDVACDAAGNAYVAFADTPASRLDKLDPSGALVWSRRLSPASGFDAFAALAVRVAESGQVVVAGMGLVPIGFAEVQIFAYDADGSQQWATSYPGSLATMDVDAAGGVWTWGGDNDLWYSDTALELVHHRADGGFEWQVTFDSPWYPYAVALEVSELGHAHAVAVTGSSLWVTHTLRVSPTGSVEWSEDLSGTDAVAAEDVALGPDGSVWLTGTVGPPDSSKDLMIARYQSDGQLAWQERFTDPDTSWSYGRSLVVAPDGNAFVTGARDPVASGPYELLVASYDSAGTLRWSASFADPETAYNFGTVTALDPRGNAFAAGRVEVPSAQPKRKHDLFVAKLLGGESRGDAYCDPAVANSTGLPGRLWAAGSDVVPADNLSLVADQLPPQQFAMFLAGQARDMIPNVGGGQGTLCIGGPIGRYNRPGQLRSSDAAGRVSLQLYLDETPTPNGLVAVVAGETWDFQAWYRDENPTNTSNLTNGVEVVFH